jgi:predicted enzyme related to lactoylglutathione lyase
METAQKLRIKNMTPLLLVADIERSVAFYAGKLGFAEDFRYEDFYCGIIKDGFSIHLKLGNVSPEQTKSKRLNQDVDIIFSVDRIESLYDALLTENMEVVQPLRNMPYGREFYIADPDGNLIAFVKG